MSKVKTAYVCSQCAAQFPKWAGQCPECKSWNTVEEQQVHAAPKDTRRSGYAGDTRRPMRKLSSVDVSSTKTRFGSHNHEFDRVLGGGFVEGGVVLLGGDPGIGKSTLLLQTICNMSSELPALYVSGEESEQQIALRARRLGLQLDQVDVLCEVELESIMETLRLEKPKLVVIDSIQTIYSGLLESAQGSVSQVRHCAAELTRHAKTTGTIIVLVGHVTKDGAIAGPRVLEHIVDAVLYFEGDQQMSFRMIRAFKNRFGAVNEIGVFAMGENGLSEVPNPSALFLTQHKHPVSGACVAAIAEGTRSLLLEVQALVEDTASPNPNRLCVGMDPNRLKMILAVMQKSLEISTQDQNVFLNITSGAKVGETGGDLPALLAILSSIRNKPLPPKLIAFGEIGLTGELRVVQRGQERLAEAAKMGFEFALIPSGNMPKHPPAGLEIKPIDTLDEALLALQEYEEKVKSSSPKHASKPAKFAKTPRAPKTSVAHDEEAS
jgi:DNA repair protein RadA/Sms